MRASWMFTLACAALAAATDASAQTVAITGGRVHTAAGAPMENATVLIRDGRITQVGTNVAIPAGAQRIDAAGKWVTPGLINAATQLGLVEVGAESRTRDVSARGKDNIAAAFTVWDGLNPASVLLAPARNEGITTVVVKPSGGLVAGQAAVVDLVDGSLGDMLVRAPVAMVGQVGSPQSAGVNARAELSVKLKELLEDARAYARRRADFERGGTRDFAASRLDLEAMVPVVEGRLPLILVADRASDIEHALRLAREYNVRIMIASGAEAWMVADKLAAANVPVFTGAMTNIPNFASLGARQENAAMLRRAGVDVVLIGDDGVSDAETFNVRNLKQEAGNAVAYGMSWDDALRAVTAVPARVLGIGDRYGTIEPGKIANVVVWSGDPFEFGTRAEHVFVRGREIATPSRQDLLERRYRSLPPDYTKP